MKAAYANSLQFEKPWNNRRSPTYMHLDGLDLNLLVVLDALFSEKSVTRTGARIHLSQSATSGALSRLREYFKDDLLVPVGRKMVLTPLAEELAQPLRELLQQAEVVIRRTPAF